jgi:hypothetical protein
MNKIKALWRFFCLGEICFVFLYQILKQQLIIKIMKETVRDVIDYFDKEYPYVDLGMLSENSISGFLVQEYIIDLSFERKMDCLYDYILSQGLCDVEE